jgi:hypothetical protein
MIGAGRFSHNINLTESFHCNAPGMEGRQARHRAQQLEFPQGNMRRAFKVPSPAFRTCGFFPPTEGTAAPFDIVRIAVNFI